MSLSDRTQKHLDTLRLVECVSQSLGRVAWILGEYTADIYLNKILREPDDLDYFYGTRIHVVAPELQYVLKEHPELLNAAWQIREKDILDKECSQHILIRKGASIDSLCKLATSTWPHGDSLIEIVPCNDHLEEVVQIVTRLNSDGAYRLGMFGDTEREITK
jgi:hypothetical protein